MEGAAGPLVLLTAWQAAGGRGAGRRGSDRADHGRLGRGGLGRLDAGQGLGARVVALSRGAAKRGRLQELGADFVFDSEIRI